MDNVIEAVTSLVGSNNLLKEQNSFLISRNRILEDENMALRKSACDSSRFYNCALNTGIVAELHSVSSELVRKYVKLGLIPVHPMSSDAKILIRASDALMLDFAELKRVMLNTKK